MLRTTIAAAWLAGGLLGLLTVGVAAHADEEPSSEPTITCIHFDGATHLNVNELAPYMSLTEGAPYEAAKVSEDSAVIIRRYKERGYPFVQCHSSCEVNADGEAVLTHSIVEGPKVKVQRVEFAGNQFVSGDELAFHLESHKPDSSRTNFAVVEDDVIRLTEYYRSFGYLDVAVSYELQMFLDTNEAVMMFHITEGEHYKQK